MLLTPSQRDLLIHTLLATGNLVSNNIRMQHEFKDAGIIDTLIAILGWPSQRGLSTPESKIVEERLHLNTEEPEWQFEIQILAAQVLLTMGNNDSAISDYIHSHGGFDKFIQLILYG